MAAAASSFSHLTSLLVGLTLLLLLSTSAHSLTCESQKFNNNKSFKSCVDLPTLKAYLFWNYSEARSTLSMAFMAPPPAKDGWVAWGLNPNGTGMIGAQALIAFKKSNGSISANTYDIKGYSAINEGRISYNVTGITAEESGGNITIFADWVLPDNMKDVNQVWQVGPVSGGKIGKHDMKPENLNGKGKLSLVGGSGAPAPAGGHGISSNVTTPTPAPVSPSPSGAGDNSIKKLGFYAFIVVIGAFALY